MAPTPWYQTSIVIAIIGSLLILVSQLSDTLISIRYGPESVSDFSVYAEEPAVTFPPNQNQLFTRVYVEDIHSRLRPYMHAVHLIIHNQPEGINIDFSKGDLVGTNEVDMIISHIPNQTIPSGKYLVDIVGIGGDEKKRNCSVLLIIPNPLETYNVTIANILKSDNGLNISIVNNGTTAMNLTDWRLVTDNRNATYQFPLFILKPKAQVTVHSNKGNDTDGNLYGSNFAWDGTHEVRLFEEDEAEYPVYNYFLSATSEGKMFRY